MNVSRGVYFLANDYVLDRAIAFLNSFRRFNPDMPLCLIPFADNADGVLALQERYNFSVWSGSPSLLETCDELSVKFHGEFRGHYRKLVAWEGEFDEFIYVDTDTIVLGDMSFVFEYLDRYGFVTSVSDHPELFEWVWMYSIRQAGVLNPRQINYSAGTGFLASRKEYLRFADVVPRLADAVELAPHMQLITIEQPLLNYLMVTSGWPCTSLRRLAGAVASHEPPPGDLPVERWAGNLECEVRDGQIVSAVPSPIFLVHWAGLWWELERGERKELPLNELWSYYRHLDDKGAPEADQLVGNR